MYVSDLHNELVDNHAVFPKSYRAAVADNEGLALWMIENQDWC